MVVNQDERGVNENSSRTVRIETGSRLHFGLLGMSADAPRRFGGAGLMVEEPGVAVTVRPASSWSAQGPCAERALAFGRRFLAASHLGEGHAFAIEVARCASEHSGLGTGTQLGLAVAAALAKSLDLAMPAVELARRIGRGERSAVGIHGFEMGGFVVDGGKGPAPAIAPLIARLPFPDDWHILLVMPRNRAGEHGPRELEAFARLAHQDSKPATADLSRLTLLGMLPALVEHDLPVFGESLYEFNRRVGEMFRVWQGGIYAHPQTASLVDWLRGRGIKGVGQSSWGPAVFAVGEENQLRDAQSSLPAACDLTKAEVFLTKALNHGARAVYEQQS